MCKGLMLPNCRCRKNKWVFKIKCNSMYHVHLIACGCSQVHSANFSKTYSPVVNVITFCILLTMVLYFDYSAKIVLEEEIYMEFPQVMSDIKKDDCINLNKCIYGLVQAARQYYKKAVKIRKYSGFVRGNVNPYLYVRKSVKGVVYLALYIDDNLMVGDVKEIDDAISAPRK